MHVLVLGAGVIGTTAAWYLHKSGHEVTVLERQGGAGRETSFANGGQISVSHAEPWANPSAPLKVLRWLGQEDAPLLFRLRADWRQWKWGLSFLAQCTPGNTRHNIEQIVNLGMYSRAALQELRRDTQIRYDHLERGILHFYTSELEWKAAQLPAKVMSEHGEKLDMITPEEVVAIEPSLHAVRDEIVGGSMTMADESGDAGMFTRELARLCAVNNVEFRTNTTILGLDREGDEIAGVRVRQEDGSYATLKADAYLVCMGSYSPMLLAPHGIDLNIYPAKGYSVTMPVADPERAYNVSLTDDEYKLVFSRLGDRLRIAGTAELNGYDLDLNKVRCEAIVRRVEHLFPGGGDTSQASFWTGLRPCTPSNVPYIGKTRIRNLFLDTGHGTLGWTHSCGSGRAIADIISGRTPEVNFAFTHGTA
ncbi:D-amino acid dehydrogenase [Terrihabitans sp. B22-R8]|uniref:D-amino acid dehydrogenase n=1 Tax=Terrihabitans sp. B22-R8 TaxID=3425128 RepID=UPI00403C36CB